MSAVQEQTSGARSEFPMPWVLNESPGWKAQWERMCDEIDQLRKQVEYVVIERDAYLSQRDFLNGGITAVQAAIDQVRDRRGPGWRS